MDILSVAISNSACSCLNKIIHPIRAPIKQLVTICRESRVGATTTPGGTLTPNLGESMGSTAPAMRLLLIFLGALDCSVAHGDRLLHRYPPFHRSPHRRGLFGPASPTEGSHIEPTFDKDSRSCFAQTPATNAVFSCDRTGECGHLRDLFRNESQKRKPRSTQGSGHLVCSLPGFSSVRYIY